MDRKTNRVCSSEFRTWDTMTCIIFETFINIKLAILIWPNITIIYFFLNCTKIEVPSYRPSRMCICYERMQIISYRLWKYNFKISKIQFLKTISFESILSIFFFIKIIHTQHFLLKLQKLTYVLHTHTKKILWTIIFTGFF